MIHRAGLALLVAAFACGPAAAQDDAPLLLRQPSVSGTSVVFAYADDLWIADRRGGEARRLTTAEGQESSPFFSPDGSLVAFTGHYDGNNDVYVIPAAGGEPRRLTYHPADDVVAGWTRDGTGVLFTSGRAVPTARTSRLYTIALDGGLPAEVPLPMAWQGSYSQDGRRLACVPLPGAFQVWKHYRGGMASKVWIADLSDSSVVPIPRQDSNDFNPMWMGDVVYFLSDRDGPVTLFAYDTKSGRVRQVVPPRGLDIKSASAGPDVIVYEQFGSLHLYDPVAGLTRDLEIRVAPDLPSVRPHYENVAEQIANAALSPTGKRAVFEARGEILTVPAEKGDIRNLTGTVGAADRDPAWSPDGKWIAYFSDRDGEYALYVQEQDGLSPARRIGLGDPPSFFYQPVWSPDSTKIAYTDKRLNLWYVGLEGGKPVLVDTDTYDAPFRSLDPAWAPDSRWIAYTKLLPSHLRAAFLYSLGSGETRRITDGMSDARYAVFDREGKYLYVTASTDAGPTTGWIDMSAWFRPSTRSVYVVVLARGVPSPLAPESDEENGAEAKEPEAKADKDKSKDKEKKVEVKVDFDGIDQRILALPIAAANYAGLAAGKAGVLYLLEAPPVLDFNPGPMTLHKFDLKKRKTDRIADGVTAFVVSQDGEKMLYQKDKQWVIASASEAPKPGEGILKLDGMRVLVDPRAEWGQMYHEVWRIERDFLYDPGAHGLDLTASERAYRPYLARLGSRDDLNYLFREMLGNLVLGHTFVRGGDLPKPPEVKTGLLGADYSIENGRYRFARVYQGENWNPDLRAPLTPPGVDVRAGEYLLSVDGEEVRPPRSVYAYFQATAGRSVRLRVGPDPAGKGARDVTVVPVESEQSLRYRDWIESNRRRVDELSGGRVAYVYLPNTGEQGYTNFNRYYFAQIGRQGAVIDERWNGGGLAADYIVDHLKRPLMNYWSTREGKDITTPVDAIFGPKAMIINEFAGSGGDAMPWYFRKAGVGPLVGKRTWGGLVGIYGYPQLMDGGSVTAPRFAFWSPDGTWDVENHGVDPDIEVELDPAAWRRGGDPQIEKAVAVVLEQIDRNSRPAPRKPAFPVYH